MKDMECNYLLASNAGGRMPCHLQLECGLGGQPELSSMEESDDSETTGAVATKTVVSAMKTTQSRKRTLIEAEAATEVLKNKM